MEKEIKKLESRQDVLDVWVSKWAVMFWFDLEKVEYLIKWWVSMCCIYSKQYGWWYDIEKILYSPESNFFEVMFPEKYKEENSFDEFKNQSDRCKAHCVTEPDPLAFLISRLNETTS